MVYRIRKSLLRHTLPSKRFPQKFSQIRSRIASRNASSQPWVAKRGKAKVFKALLLTRLSLIKILHFWRESSLKKKKIRTSRCPRGQQEPHRSSPFSSNYFRDAQRSIYKRKQKIKIQFNFENKHQQCYADERIRKNFKANSVHTLSSSDISALYKVLSL